jgi:6-phospho-beta-glucosidase
MSDVAPLTLSVLGGSSPATPVLIAALRRAQQAGRLGEIELRLHGRNLARLQRICEFASQTLQRDEAASARDGTPALAVAASGDLGETLSGATHVLCMVRPGGMSGRAEDELLARRAGAVADEGLGVGGLRCYLRGREVIEQLARACARHAPRAQLLQMSSPLGLNVALSRRVHGDRVVGICELPRTTAQRLAELLGSSARLRFASHSHAGLNHQSWLYAFRDDRGRDITAQILAALPTDTGLGVDTQRIRELGAVPVHYLRLYVHPRRVWTEQQRTGVRGSVLGAWSERVEHALCAPGGPDTPRVTELLAGRRMDWFDEGVVPLLEALLDPRDSSFTLNVPAAGAMPDAPADAIVEIGCRVSSGSIQPEPVPPLPPGPAALTRTLLNFERAAFALPPAPTARELADVLAAHPLVPRRRIRMLARTLAEVRAEPAGASHMDRGAAPTAAVPREGIASAAP